MVKIKASTFTVVLLALSLRCSAQALPFTPEAHVSPWPTAALLVSNGVDLGTTIDGLTRGDPRLHERDPLLGSKLASIIPLKTATAIVEVLAERHLERTGHKTLARVVGYATSALFVVVASQNYHLVHGRVP